MKLFLILVFLVPVSSHARYFQLSEKNDHSTLAGFVYERYGYESHPPNKWPRGNESKSLSYIEAFLKKYVDNEVKDAYVEVDWPNLSVQIRLVLSDQSVFFLDFNNSYRCSKEELNKVVSMINKHILRPEQPKLPLYEDYGSDHASLSKSDTYKILRLRELRGNIFESGQSISVLSSGPVLKSTSASYPKIEEYVGARLHLHCLLDNY